MDFSDHTPSSGDGFTAGSPQLAERPLKRVIPWSGLRTSEDVTPAIDVPFSHGMGGPLVVPARAWPV
jgi:hypothetical protein